MDQEGLITILALKLLIMRRNVKQRHGFLNDTAFTKTIMSTSTF